MSKIWKNGVQLYDCIEKIVGKEEIAHYEQFLLSPQCFQSCLLLMRQNEYLWSKGLRAESTNDLLIQVLCMLTGWIFKTSGVSIHQKILRNVLGLISNLFTKLKKSFGLP